MCYYLNWEITLLASFRFRGGKRRYSRRSSHGPPALMANGKKTARAPSTTYGDAFQV